LKTKGGNERVERKKPPISSEDRAAGFYVAADTNNNITILRNGRRVAWLSASMSKGMIHVIITLVKELETETGESQNKPV
jgi:hypothetical protein